jgi:phosphopantothenoylcysteine decarboxylase / phosphopantothenate---cysteine ligase
MILLGITGGIAAYKTPELVRLLRKAGHAVQVVMTESATQFVTPLTLQTLSGRPVRTQLFELTEEETISHIALADRAEAVLVAPATANCLAKVAHGLCDDLLTTVIAATCAPVTFAPAMNVKMWNNPITRRNVTILQEAGYTIIPPDAGELACGYTGEGRLPPLTRLVEAVARCQPIL